MKLLAYAALAALVAAPAAAATLRITVTNDAAPDGFALTPVYTAVHNGSFDAFTNGEAASPGVETIAELGSPAGLPAERLAADPDSAAVVVFGGAPGSPRPIFGGETASAELTVADPASQRFLTFLSMVVPSNDTFIGNDDPLAFALFDAGGAFLGPQTITVTGAFIYDAGTEVNDPLGNPAFVAGQDATGPFDANGDPIAGGAAAEGGVISQGMFGLADFAGVTTAPGFVLGDAAQLDFLTDPDAFAVATITIEEVAPIPLPAAGWMLLAGMGALAGLRRRA